MERDLLHCLLEVEIVEHFKSVAVDEQLVVALDLSVTALDEALRAGLLAALVAVEAQALDALHLVLPLLADDLEEPLGTDVLLIIGIVVDCILRRRTSSACVRLWGLPDCRRRIHVVIII